MALFGDPYQYTLKKNVSCCGIGLHSGRTVNLTLKPASIDSGIRFVRTDIPVKNYINASVDRVVDTRLATTIGKDSFHISTTEHLLAALRGFGIDNVDIELDSPEVPIMDGSAGPFIHLLKKSGKRKQAALRKVLRITKKITYENGDKNITFMPYDGFKVSGKIDFDDALIRKQSFEIDITPEKFIKEIASARTFGYVEQVEELWSNGLALGGTLDSVIAIHWNRKSVLNENGLRYKNEFIRHKVLDIVGDLTLLGCPIQGHVIANKTGHTEHYAFMKAVCQAPHCWELIELKENGAHAVLKDMVSSTMGKGEAVMPFFNRQRSVVMACKPAV